MTIAAVLDRRINAFRADLADIRLEGLVEAERFVEGAVRRVNVPITSIRRNPRSDAPIESEALLGERVRVFEETAEGWAWAQLETDGCVGFIAAEALGPVDPEPTHRISALRTFIYPAADMKFPAVAALSLNSQVTLGEERETRGTLYRLLASGAGAIVSHHAAPIVAPPEPDFVAVAERFLNVPYLWGGRSSLGIDCSGLVQTSLAACGIVAPRDSDQQQAAVGAPVEGGIAAPLQRGDLIFWKGHVGMLTDPGTLLHASGTQMIVLAEPLSDALERIGRSSGAPTMVRRLPVNNRG